MLTNEKYDIASSIAKTCDKTPAVIIEYITMPKHLRESVSHQVFEQVQASGLSLADYVAQNRASLTALATRNTMSLTVLVAFVLDLYEEQESAQRNSLLEATEPVTSDEPALCES